MLEHQPLAGQWDNNRGAWYRCGGIWIFVPENLPGLDPLRQAISILTAEINVRDGADQGGH